MHHQGSICRSSHSTSGEVYNWKLASFMYFKQQIIGYAKVLGFSRITSYNVCYTKLLRMMTHMVTVLDLLRARQRLWAIMLPIIPRAVILVCLGSWGRISFRLGHIVIPSNSVDISPS